MTQESIIKNDRLTRFFFEDFDVRGELVTVEKTYQAMLENHAYPEPVIHLLGELLVVTCLLTATLKFEGTITVQLHGDGPLSLTVINGNNHQQMRGIARVKEEIKPEDTFKEMIGNGYMVITITPNKGKHYQGIVALEKETLAECIEDYFMQSEQLVTKIFFRIGKKNNNAIAAGILLQILPSANNMQHDFAHLTTLTETIKANELFTLPAEAVLFRLYHQEKVRIFEDEAITFCCGCSRQRCAVSLMTLSHEDINAILDEDGQLDLLCDYCGKHYVFNHIDIANLQQSSDRNNDTIH